MINDKDEDYIENEFKLRVHDREIKSLHNKLNFIIATLLTIVIIPLFLKALN